VHRGAAPVQHQCRGSTALECSYGGLTRTKTPEQVCGCKNRCNTPKRVYANVNFGAPCPAIMLFAWCYFHRSRSRAHGGNHRAGRFLGTGYTRCSVFRSLPRFRIGRNRSVPNFCASRPEFSVLPVVERPSSHHSRYEQHAGFILFEWIPSGQRLGERSREPGTTATGRLQACPKTCCLLPAQTTESTGP
jgi:hypothetical protein